MYRIIFSPATAKWQIQLQSIGIFWTTVCEQVPTGDGPTTRKQELSFANYDEAAAYVEQVGLANVYRNYHDSRTHQLLQGYQPHPAYHPQVRP